MSQDNKNSYITYDEREIIETSIEHGFLKQVIADSIEKDNSTVGKKLSCTGNELINAHNLTTANYDG